VRQPTHRLLGWLTLPGLVPLSLLSKSQQGLRVSFAVREDGTGRVTEQPAASLQIRVGKHTGSVCRVCLCESSLGTHTRTE
jgi:hypothetical protein